MKKIILSTLLVLSFSTYIFYKRSVSASDMLPIIPSSPVTSNAENTSPTQTPSSVSSETTNQATNISQPTATPIPVVASGYKDGSYTGTAADAFYGYIQVKATISGGKLTDVVFLQYPNDRDRSVFINQQAMPYLKQEAIAAQSASVNIVSGATDSSQAFIQSLSSALSQAKS